MPVPMPYYLEKGPFFAVLEHYLNSGDPERLVTALQMLRNGDGWETFEVLGSTTLVNPNQRNAVAWATHIYRHWFGMEQDTATGSWNQQPAFDKETNPQTGYWQGYYGDVDAITRQTLIRALEVALGVDHAGKGATVSPTRRWKIDFLWKCSQAWFEGWVTWRRHGTNPSEGQVTVFFATPPVAGSVVLTSPLAGRNLPEFRKDPANTKTSGTQPTESDQGMWVVTHTNNKPYTPDVTTTTAGSRVGKWLSPLPGRVHSTDAVVTVAPSMADGGVLPTGLQYQAPGT